MKKMILASLFLSCAAFGATSNLSNAKVTPGVNSVATYDDATPWIANCAHTGSF